MTQLVDIETIKENGHNPRIITKDQFARLKKSIQEFPEMLHPREIIVDEEMTVLGGNMRLRALRDLGQKQITIKVASGLTPEQKKEFIIKDNAAFGEWDFDVLGNLYSDLPLEDWGLQVPDGFLKEPEDERDAEPQIDRAEELNEKWKVVSGDLWLIGEHRLLCGDSTVQEDVIEVMGGQTAQMVFTDPPYNVDYGVSKNPRHKIHSIENDKQSPAEWERFCRNIFTAFKKHNEGDIYLWGASSPEGMKMRLWLTEMGCHWSATIVWKKQQLVLTPANYQRMYEPCFYGWFGKSSFNGDRTQTEVWEIDRPLDSKLHPTMKPVELCAKGIINSSVSGSVVMDLFLGSGSTMVAAQNLNRKCYGIEISPEYCAVILERMATAFPELPIVRSE